MHLRGAGVARQHLFERTHLVSVHCRVGKLTASGRSTSALEKSGTVRSLAINAMRSSRTATFGVDQHDGIVDDVGTIAGVGVREEHHLDAAREILQLR